MYLYLSNLRKGCVMSINNKMYDIFACKKGRYYDVIFYDSKEEEAFFCEGVNENELSGVDNRGNVYQACVVSQEMFQLIEDGIHMDFGGFTGGNPFNKSSTKAHKQKSLHASSDKALQILNGTMAYKELKELYGQDFERGEYCDIDAMLSVIKRFMNGEYTEDYFKYWLIAMISVLYSASYKKGSKAQKISYELADIFDGFAFRDFKKMRSEYTRELLAFVKDIKHRFDNKDRREAVPFYNNDSIIVYVSFDFCNSHNTFFNVCVADERKGIFNLGTVVNPDYLEDVNYTFIGKREYMDLRNLYYEYYCDNDLNIKEYISELPYLDKNGTPC